MRWCGGWAGEVWEPLKVRCTHRKELPEEEEEALVHGLEVREVSGMEDGGVGFGMTRQ